MTLWAYARASYAIPHSFRNRKAGVVAMADSLQRMERVVTGPRRKALDLEGLRQPPSVQRVRTRFGEIAPSPHPASPGAPARGQPPPLEDPGHAVPLGKGGGRGEVQGAEGDPETPGHLRPDELPHPRDLERGLLDGLGHLPQVRVGRQRLEGLSHRPGAPHPHEDRRPSLARALAPRP
ncbi:MAG: hypothetical protein Kow0092_33360 [Deferrisomatales bacterium]